MSLHTWWLFVMMTFVVSATPGPNMLLVMSTGARQGLRYLAYLGVQVWRSPVQEAPADGGAPSQLGEALSTWALYRQGALVAASNPKAILFAAAFFPQFLNPALPQLPQFGILLSTFAVVEVAWYFVYAASGKQLARYLQRASVMRAFNRLTGGVFVGFAALMAGAKS